MAGSGRGVRPATPRIVEEGPPMPEGPKTQAQHPRGPGRTFSFAESPPGLGTLPDRGDVQHTKGRSRGPPEEPTKEWLPPLLFAAPQGVGVTPMRFPPEARPSRRMARGVPKGPNRRFDRRSYRLNGGPAGGGGGAPGGRRELFFFRNPAPSLRNPRLLRVAGLGNPAQTAWPHSCSCRPLAILALRAL